MKEKGQYDTKNSVCSNVLDYCRWCIYSFVKAKTKVCDNINKG